MANEWIEDVAEHRATLGDAAGDYNDVESDESDDADVRYGLTPLGARTLAQSRAFTGFGPCSVATSHLPAPPVPRTRGANRSSKRRTTPLFG